MSKFRKINTGKKYLHLNLLSWLICYMILTLFLIGCEEESKKSNNETNNTNNVASNANQNTNINQNINNQGQTNTNTNTNIENNENPNNIIENNNQNINTNNHTTQSGEFTSHICSGFDAENISYECVITGDITSSENIFIKGNILGLKDVYYGGAVLINKQHGNLSCVGCDCEQTDAVVIDCGGNVVSPGLINSHDHITFATIPPIPHGNERYEHRHDWRKGKRGHSKINLGSTRPGGADIVRWGEVRMLISGVTSMEGSGEADGLVRNLDRSADEDLNDGTVKYSTFPLGDSGGSYRTNNCTYDDLPSNNDINGFDGYIPHVSEGIDAEAHNEFICMSSTSDGGVKAVSEKSSFIHNIALTLDNVATIASEGRATIWSPRSNIDLYGNTAPVTIFDTFYVPIALGTDWTPSGSMNMLREMQCADYLNQNYYNKQFSDYDIWLMATYNGALVAGAHNLIGALERGMVADIAIYKANASHQADKVHRAVIDAEVTNVLLVLRDGEPLYGEKILVDGLLPTEENSKCEDIDVCSNAKKLCIKRDIGKSLNDIKDRIGDNPFELFFCSNTIPEEPSCSPYRDEYNAGISENDSDGDGIINSADNCPLIFNPVRPMDDGAQTDSDADMLGDHCDPCPYDANSTDCDYSTTPPEPDMDRDDDGKDDWEDNCPGVANEDQADRDNDDIGDVCDLCPDQAGGVCAILINDVRDPSSQTRPVAGDNIRFEGAVVTHVRTLGDRSFGFYIQQSPAGGSYEGIFVYTNADLPVASSGAAIQTGDVVNIEGAYDVFSDIDQLASPSVIEVTGQSTPIPFVAQISELRGTTADAYESLLVQVENVIVTNLVDGKDSFWVSTNQSESCDENNTNCLLISDFELDKSQANGEPSVQVGDSLSKISGIINGYRSSYSLEIRTLNDIVQ